MIWSCSLKTFCEDLLPGSVIELNRLHVLCRAMSFSIANPYFEPQPLPSRWHNSQDQAGMFLTWVDYNIVQHGSVF